MKSKLTKNKTCKNCKEKFDQERLLQYVCSPECAYEYSKKLNDKKTRKKTRENLESIKDIRIYKKELQLIVNEIARLIDKDQSCISCNQGKCGCSDSVQFAGGHFKHVGSNEILRFNLHNIHRQCNKKCNEQYSGAPLEYIEGIISEYGMQYGEFIRHELKAQFNDLHFDREMIKEAKKIASAERNKLKKLNMIYPTKTRIRLRSEINKKIGIYEQR